VFELSNNAGEKRVAEAVADFRGSFTTADVRERLAGEPNPWSVRQQLAALVETGHLDRTETPNGVATQLTARRRRTPARWSCRVSETHIRTTQHSVYSINGLSGVDSSDTEGSRHRPVTCATLPSPEGHSSR
jgi:hypothetical protein